VIRNNPNYSSVKRLFWQLVGALLFLFVIGLSINLESFWPFGIFIASLILFEFWDTLRPHPDFVPYQPPTYFKSRKEEVIWPLLFWISWLHIPILFISSLYFDFRISGAFTFLPIGVLFLSGFMLAYFEHIRSHDPTGEESPDGFKPKTRLKRLLIAVMGFIAAFFIAGSQARDDTSLWFGLPFLWLIFSGLYEGLLWYRSFEPFKPPYYFKTRTGGLISSVLGPAAIAAWCIGILLFAREHPLAIYVLVPSGILGAIVGLPQYYVQRKRRREYYRK